MLSSEERDLLDAHFAAPTSGAIPQDIADVVATAMLCESSSCSECGNVHDGCAYTKHMERAYEAIVFLADTLTAATSTPQEGLACLVERCGCDGSAPCGQDDISECVPAVRVQCVECARLDTSDCLYADEHMVDDGCWFDARNASRPKVAKLPVPQEVAEALALAVNEAESWIHDQLDGASSLDAALAELQPAIDVLNAIRGEATDGQV